MDCRKAYPIYRSVGRQHIKEDFKFKTRNFKSSLEFIKLIVLDTINFIKIDWEKKNGN